MSANTDRIRMLNDELRQHLLGGGAVMTPGIAALEKAFRFILDHPCDDRYIASDLTEVHGLNIDSGWAKRFTHFQSSISS